MKGPRKAGKARRATSGRWAACPISRQAYEARHASGRKRPGSVEKQLQQTTIVYGDNFQEL